MINRQLIEDFLIYKYGVDSFRYKGFLYIREILFKNEDYIAGHTTKTYKEIADNFNVVSSEVERAIRYFKKKLAHNKDTNTVFINSLIFEFKKYKGDD